MAEYHYVVAYNDKTKKWSLEDETQYLDGNIWVPEESEWIWPHPDVTNTEIVDERCRNMINALLPIWPEVDDTHV